MIYIATDIGHALLANGAEIYRVEESMQHIFCAYGVETGNIFAIPTCINVTISTPEGRPITLIKRIYSRTINLDRVEHLNDLCRRICRDLPDYQTISRELREIGSRPVYGFAIQVLAFSMVAFAFTLFFGGNFGDAFVSMFCGAAIKLVYGKMDQLNANPFFVNISSSFVAALVAFIAAHFYPGLNADKIIIGALMNLVPGIAITSVMRDIIAGDLMAGIIRLTESLLVAAAIAIGSGVALGLVRLIWGA